jgi:hypothetical protein
MNEIFLMREENKLRKRKYASTLCVVSHPRDVLVAAAVDVKCVLEKKECSKQHSTNPIRGIKVIILLKPSMSTYAMFRAINRS